MGLLVSRYRGVLCIITSLIITCCIYDRFIFRTIQMKWRRRNSQRGIDIQLSSWRQKLHQDYSLHQVKTEETEETNTQRFRVRDILQYDHMMLRQMWCWPAVAADCPPLRSCGSRTVWCRPCWRWRDRAVGRDVSAEDTICPVWWSSSLVSSDQREARLWRTPASSASETHTDADNEILKHELSVWLFCSTWTHCLQLHSDSQFNNYHL